MTDLIDDSTELRPVSKDKQSKNDLIDSILEEELGFSVFTFLDEKLRGDGQAHVDLLKPIVSERIECLETRLQTPLDAPTWGPHTKNGVLPKFKEPRLWARIKAALGKTSDEHNKSKGQITKAVLGNADPVGVTISRNLDQSERYFNFRWLYGLALILGIAVFLLAMAVDYQIMTELWTRALANEFLEVPASLANSILFKSFQVVIATIAFHFFLSLLGVRGRAMFVLVFFVLSAVMVAGFGFINAKQAMPADQLAIFEQSPAAKALDDPFKKLGIVSSAEAAITSPPSSTIISAETMRGTQSLSWFLSPALVFLVVTAVGALSLQVAESNVTNFVRARDFIRRQKREREWKTLKQSEKYINKRVNRTNTTPRKLPSG